MIPLRRTILTFACPLRILLQENQLRQIMFFSKPFNYCLLIKIITYVITGVIFRIYRENFEFSNI